MKIKFKITKEQLKDIGVRMLKTALEVALATLIGSLTLITFTDVNGLKLAVYNIAITVGAAVLTALLNILLKLLKNIIDDWKLTTEEIDEAFGGAE